MTRGRMCGRRMPWDGIAGIPTRDTTSPPPSFYLSLPSPPPHLVVTGTRDKETWLRDPHCKPGEAYTRLITASCEAGPGTTHMCTFEICIRTLLILDFAARCVFHNSIFGLSKCYLYIEFRKYLKLSCQGSNHHPFNSLW